MSVILLSGDLMLASQVGAAAARQDVPLRTVSSSAELTESFVADSAALVIIELGAADSELSSLVSELRSSEKRRATILAFGPHVHEEKLEAARAAGCDVVLSRGAFHARMDELIRTCGG